MRPGPSGPASATRRPKRRFATSAFSAAAGRNAKNTHPARTCFVAVERLVLSSWIRQPSQPARERFSRLSFLWLRCYPALRFARRELYGKALKGWLRRMGSLRGPSAAQRPAICGPADPSSPSAATSRSSRPASSRFSPAPSHWPALAPTFTSPPSSTASARTSLSSATAIRRSVIRVLPSRPAEASTPNSTGGRPQSSERLAGV